MARLVRRIMNNTWHLLRIPYHGRVAYHDAELTEYKRLADRAHVLRSTLRSLHNSKDRDIIHLTLIESLPEGCLNWLRAHQSLLEAKSA